MRTGGVLNILGKLLILISLCLLTPIPFSLYFKDGMIATFLLSAGLGAILGLLLLALFAPEKDLGYRDGFAVVVLSWLGLAFLGALPFYFSGKMPLFVDCFFESMSGFTTTGILLAIARTCQPGLFAFVPGCRIAKISSVVCDSLPSQKGQARSSKISLEANSTGRRERSVEIIVQ